MKTLSLITKTALLGAISTMMFAGCTTSGKFSANTVGPVNEPGEMSSAGSVISFTPPTDTQQIAKWWLSVPGMRSIETYSMAVPAAPTAAQPELAEVDVDLEEGRFDTALQPGAYFEEAAGAAGAGETQTRRVILHRPHQR